MQFISITFLIFFSIVSFLFFLQPQSWRNVWLLFVSYLFIASWSVSYTLVFALMTTINYFIGLQLASLKGDKIRQSLLAFGVGLNVVYLITLKTIKVEDLLLQFNSHLLDVLTVFVAVGISFYTFQMIAYLFDVYRRKIQPEHSYIVFSLFAAFFPQLVSGPIPRADQLIPQFRRNISFDETRIVEGLRLVLWGLLKKVAIADHLGIYVAAIFDHAHNYTGIPLIFATVCFTFQIYCDFSAYSNIAIGLAKILGYSLNENFQQPYLSPSISIFWRRWHITLSTWIRDYLFIPLSRVLLRRSQNRHARLIHVTVSVIVMTLVGLWHGLGWNFVVWGALHGFYLGFASFKIFNFQKRKPQGLETLWRIMFTFALVSFAAIFFRALSLSDAFYIVGHLFQFQSLPLQGFTLGMAANNPTLEFLIALVLIAVIVATDIYATHWNFNTFLNQIPVTARWSLYYGALLLMLVLGSGGTATFIYFQF